MSNRDTSVKFLMMPKKYNFLKQTSNCHKESYYECIISELDNLDFQGLCPVRCIPDEFKYFYKNHSTPFCQKEEDEHCAKREQANLMILTFCMNIPMKQQNGGGNHH